MIRINNLLLICCLIVKPTETSTKNNYPHLDKVGKVEKEDKEDREVKEAKGDKVARTMTMMMTISSTEILMMVE